MSNINEDFFHVEQLAMDFRLKRDKRKNSFFGDCPVCGYKECFALYDNNGKPGWHCYSKGCNLWDVLRTSPYAHKVASQFKAPALDKSQGGTQKSKDWWQRILRECWKAPGTVVEAYLHSRGYHGPIPESLRYHPSLYYKDTKQYFPAMVAPIIHYPTKRTIGIHRTYLKPDGSGKADVKPAKKILGQCMTGGVFLADPANIMAVAEGIETALSYQALTGTPTVAALSCGGMRKLILPSKPMAQVVYVAADNDTHGKKSAKAAVDRFLRERRTVSMAVAGYEGEDFNDVLMRCQSKRDGHDSKSE
ncbi:MAG: toprim domain-containing protein [Rhodospirillales bacterium]|nr:toprim domain-containing protein [Rhodospirillales bacterium]MCB9994870.1 toprim domain-containing protein [Rhodospirillales bacterium]